MQISIKTLTGRKIQANFESSDTIETVKLLLQEKEGIVIPQIRLIFNGKQLDDAKTLEFYNIQSGAVMHMILALRGGQ
jgi:hypothetical protein